MKRRKSNDFEGAFIPGVMKLIKKALKESDVEIRAKEKAMKKSISKLTKRLKRIRELKFFWDSKDRMSRGAFYPGKVVQFWFDKHRQAERLEQEILKRINDLWGGN